MDDEMPVSEVANQFNTLCNDINYQTSNKYKVELEAAFNNLCRLKHHDNHKNFKWLFGKYDDVREKITCSRFLHLSPFTTVRKKKIYLTYLTKKWNFSLHNIPESSLISIKFDDLPKYMKDIDSFYSDYNHVTESVDEEYVECSLKAIYKDVNRSGFVDAEHSNITRECMEDAITATLVNFIVIESSVGYIQGLNFVTRFLLTFFSQKESLQLMLTLFGTKARKHQNFDFGSLYKDGFPLLLSIERTFLYYLVKNERKIWRAIKYGTQRSKIGKRDYLKEKSKYKTKVEFDTHVDIKIMFAGGILTLFTNVFENMFGYVFFDFIIIEGNIALVKMIISVLIFNRNSILNKTDDSFKKISTPEFFEIIEKIKYLDKENLLTLLTIYKRLKMERIM